MADFVFAPMPHSEAVDFIKSKPVVTREVFDRLLPELKARAFTIAGIEFADTLQNVRDTIAELPAGGDWSELKKQIVGEISPYLVTSSDPEERAKEEYGADRRAELLLRVHGQQAYATASYRLMDAQRNVFSNWQYQTLGDSHVRAAHAALDGVVMPHDSPFWQTHFPPWDWGCRCQAIPLSDDAVKEIKAEDASRPQEGKLVLNQRAQKTLEQSNTITRHADLENKEGGPRQFFVQAPSESGKEHAWRWQPGDARIPLKDLRSRYTPDVWAHFETWAKGQQVEGLGRTVWEWLADE